MAGPAGGGASSSQPIEGYELLKKLGEGGMGAVYLARQLSMDRPVALKILRRNLARNQDFVSRFVREARLAGKLDHQNIVRALDVGESGDYHYLAMEYIDGCNLTAVLKEEGALPEKRALDLTLQIARALEYADSHKIIHRDIKPDNILLTADGTAKLTDMGLAKQTGAETHITQTGVMVGTPHYVSPEQARGQQDVDIRGDIYSLGATLYRLVTGSTPFEGSTAAVVMTKHLTEEPPPPREINSEVSHNTSRIIYRAMAKNRDVRYQTPAELIADIQSVLAGRQPRNAQSRRKRDTVSTRPVGAVRGRKRPPERATREEEPLEARRLPLPLPAMVGIAAGLLLAAGIGLWALTGGEDPPPEGPVPPERVEPPEKPPDPLPDPPEKDKNFEEMYQYAEDFWKKNPEDYAGAQAKFEYVQTQAAGNVWGMKSEDMIKEIKASCARAAEAIFAGLKADADKLEKAGDFDGAIAAWGKPPEKFSKLLAPRYQQQRDALGSTAKAKIGAALKAAEDLSRAGQPQEGLVKLDEVKAIRYAAMAGEITALRGRLEKEKGNAASLAEKRRLAEARKQLGAILEGFDELMLEGKHLQAGEHLAGKQKDGDKNVLALIAVELGAAKKIAEALKAHAAEKAKAVTGLKDKTIEVTKEDGTRLKGKVLKVEGGVLELRVAFRIGGTTGYSTRAVAIKDLSAADRVRLLPGFKPANADGQIAAALLGIADKNYAAAEKALAKAGQHPLAQRYGELLLKKKLGAVEAAAMKAWKVGIDVRDKYDLPGAKKLIAALDGFEKAHGKTRFGKSRTADIAKLRARAQEAIDASPEGVLARIRGMFKGKLTRYDSKTRRLELFYDFDDPAQLSDWTLSGFAAGGDAGKDVAIKDGRLRLNSTGRCALLKCIFRSSMSISGEFRVHGGRGDCTVLVCADEQGNYYNLFGLQGGTLAYLERYAKGKWKPLSKKNPSPLAASKGGTLSLSYENGRLSGRVGKIPVNAKDSTYPFGRVGFWAYGTQASYDNIRVGGTLDENWLKRNLARLEAGSKPAPSYRAHWRKLKITGKGPVGRARGEQALAYDSKRKRVIFYGGTRKRDLWQLETASGRWTCLDPGSPASPAVMFHTVRYDPGSDCYWIMSTMACHAYNPNTRTWKNHGLPEGMPNWGSSNTRNGWAYDPDARRFLRLYIGGQTYSFYPAGGRVERAASMGGVRAGWVDGGLVYDRKSKVFVLFGGFENKKLSNRTWIYSPKLKQWRPASPEKSPPPRYCHNLHWHEKLGAVVLAGGTQRDRKDSDVWIFDSAAERWTQAETTGLSPAPSTGATTYDAGNDVVVHFHPKTTAVSTLKITASAGAK